MEQSPKFEDSFMGEIDKAIRGEEIESDFYTGQATYAFLEEFPVRKEVKFSEEYPGAKKVMADQEGIKMVKNGEQPQAVKIKVAKRQAAPVKIDANYLFGGGGGGGTFGGGTISDSEVDSTGAQLLSYMGKGRQDDTLDADQAEFVDAFSDTSLNRENEMIEWAQADPAFLRSKYNSEAAVAGSGGGGGGNTIARVGSEQKESIVDIMMEKDNADPSDPDNIYVNKEHDVGSTNAFTPKHITLPGYEQSRANNFNRVASAPVSHTATDNASVNANFNTGGSDRVAPVQAVIID